jgi:sugar phosphate isomerase/epimerase
VVEGQEKRMKNHAARRRFLKTAGGSVLAGVVTELFESPIALAERNSNEPSSAKFPRMFPGCCAYSYRRELLSGKMTFEDFIQKAVEMKLAAVDVTVYYLKSTDSQYLSGLRHLAYKNALAFSGAACGVSMVQPDSAKRVESLTQIKQWIDVADRLGAPHLRVFAGEIPQGRTLSDAVSWVVDTMKAATDYSGRKGITLGIEDHAGVSQNAEVCLEIMHRVNSDYAGINIDITHFVATSTQDAYAQIASCIPFATNTHIRPSFDDGSSIDLDRVWKMFSRAGFRGYMSFEGDELNKPGLVPEPILEIQRLCKKYSSM